MKHADGVLEVQVPIPAAKAVEVAGSPGLAAAYLDIAEQAAREAASERHRTLAHRPVYVDATATGPDVVSLVFRVQTRSL